MRRVFWILGVVLSFALILPRFNSNYEKLELYKVKADKEEMTTFAENIADDKPRIKDFNNKEIADGEELYAIVFFENEAESIAEKYNIELVKVKNNVATFHTDDNPNTVISYGDSKGYHKLYINYISTSTN